MSAIALFLAGEVPALLRRFACTDALSDDELVVLASRCRVEHLPADARLFAEGECDSRVILLVDGALELVATDGRTYGLAAGTPAAAQPVDGHCPRRFMARTATPVRLIRFDGTELGDWLSAPATALSSGDGSPLAEFGVLFQQFDADALDFGEPGPLAGHRLRILSGELALPSLPAIALDASRVIDRDDASAAMLARVLLNDPAITAKLMRVANSPLFYGRVAVDSCERAVLRLGLRATRQLVIAFAVREVFRNDQPMLQRLAEALWDHSTTVAALSFVLARECGGFDAAEAQLAGLLHGIGAVPVLGYAAGERALCDDPRGVATLVDSLRETLGRRLLEEWGFDARLVEVAVHAEDWWRANDGPADLADLVLVAQYLSLLGSAQAERMPALVRLPAFGRLCGGRRSVEDVLGLVAEADDQLRELRSLLRA